MAAPTYDDTGQLITYDRTGWPCRVTYSWKPSAIEADNSCMEIISEQMKGLCAPISLNYYQKTLESGSRQKTALADDVKNIHKVTPEEEEATYQAAYVALVWNNVARRFSTPKSGQGYEKERLAKRDSKHEGQWKSDKAKD
ncbi:MAG: hypothetical protein Q9226_003889 [Calogaya cf. arnoldii]